MTSPDIAEVIKATLGIDVDRRKIQLREPIRMLGTHQVDIHLIGETRAVVTVNVVDTTHPAPEEPAAAPAPAPAPAPVVEVAPADEEATE